MTNTKLEKAINAATKQVQRWPSKCDHLDGTMTKEDGIIYFTCPKCGLYASMGEK